MTPITRANDITEIYFQEPKIQNLGEDTDSRHLK